MQLHQLADFRRKQRRICFDQGELRQIFDIYSRRVARGEWRDYAIDHGAGMAVFSIFRHSCDAPLFRLVKRAGRGQRDEYLLTSGRQNIKQATTIAEVLAPLKPRLACIT